MGVYSEIIHTVPGGDTVVDINKLSSPFIDKYVNHWDSHFSCLQSLSFNDYLLKEFGEEKEKQIAEKKYVMRPSNVSEKQTITFKEIAEHFGECYKLMGYYTKETIGAWKHFLLEVGEQHPEEPVIEFHFFCSSENIPYFFRLDNKTKIVTYYQADQEKLEHVKAFYILPNDEEEDETNEEEEEDEEEEPRLEFRPRKYIKSYNKHTDTMTPLIINKDINWLDENNRFKMVTVIPSMNDIHAEVELLKTGKITWAEIGDPDVIVGGFTFKRSELMNK